jgi:hypothetical protein
MGRRKEEENLDLQPVRDYNGRKKHMVPTTAIMEGEDTFHSNRRAWRYKRLHVFGWGAGFVLNIS